MEINLRVVQGVTVVELVGELAWQSVPEAQTRILAAAQADSKMILDLTRVPYLSSAGLRLLLVVYRTISRRGGRALLVGLSEELKNTMSVTGFLDFFVSRDNLEAGIAEFAG